MIGIHLKYALCSCQVMVMGQWAAAWAPEDSTRKYQSRHVSNAPTNSWNESLPLRCSNSNWAFYFVVSPELQSSSVDGDALPHLRGRASPARASVQKTNDRADGRPVCHLRSPKSVDRYQSNEEDLIIIVLPLHLKQDGFSRQEAQRAAQIFGQGKRLIMPFEWNVYHIRY